MLHCLVHKEIGERWIRVVQTIATLRRCYAPWYQLHVARKIGVRDQSATRIERLTRISRRWRLSLRSRPRLRGAHPSIARSESPAEQDLATLHQEHLTTRTRFIATTDGFDLTWTEDTQDFARVIWPVARSATYLVLTEDPHRVKQCSGADGGCGWLFYDESKNGSRRWCSMEGCGSHAKMRRYRARKRPTGPNL